MMRSNVLSLNPEIIPSNKKRKSVKTVVLHEDKDNQGSQTAYDEPK
jgi:hypothetical protein